MHEMITIPKTQAELNSKRSPTPNNSEKKTINKKAFYCLIKNSVSLLLDLVSL